MSDETIAAAPPPADATTTVTTPAGAPEAPVSVPAVETATPAPAAAPATSLLEGGGKPEGAAAPATWPEDWRAKLAGEDPKFLKTLERFDSPAALAKSYREAQAKIATGAAKSPLPENPTPEQLADFRKEHGIPEKAEAYEVKPSNGIQFGAEDQPAIESFREHAHAKNWSQEQFGQAIDWWAGQQEQALAARQEADATFRDTAQDTLRAEWGPEYRRNLATMQNFIASHAPEGLADRLLGGRTADGRMLGDDPAFLQFLVRAARDANPMASVVPAGTADAGKAIGDELADLKKMMGDERSEYWRGPKAAGHQARYRELKSAQAAARR